MRGILNQTKNIFWPFQNLMRFIQEMYSAYSFKKSAIDILLESSQNIRLLIKCSKIDKVYNRLVRQLRHEFSVDDRTDEVHSEEGVFFVGYDTSRS